MPPPRPTPQPPTAGPTVRPTMIGRLALCTLSAALSLGSSGCYHIVMPVRSDRMPDTLVAAIASPRRTVRLVNGYEHEVLVWFRTEGAHHIGTDLREWTDRLLADLREEYDSRGVTVALPARRKVRPTDPAALVVRVTSIRGPDATGGGGAELEAALESMDGSYRERLRSLPQASKFSDALYSLKVLIIESPGLQAWILRAGER